MHQLLVLLSTLNTPLMTVQKYPTSLNDIKDHTSQYYFSYEHSVKISFSFHL